MTHHDDEGPFWVPVVCFYLTLAAVVVVVWYLLR